MWNYHNIVNQLYPNTKQKVKKKKKVCTESTQEKLFYLTDSSGNFTKGDIWAAFP